MDLEPTKLFLRVDGTEEDELIQSLMVTATKEIKRKTGKTKIIDIDGITLNDIETDEIFQLAVKIRVADFYTNRQSETDKQQYQFSHSFERMINFISLSGDYK